MIDFLSRLMPQRAAAGPLRRHDDTILLAQDPEESLPPGCGWFDSSHELQCGLVVTEHRSADSVAAELPLVDWLELHLSGWRAARVGRAG